MKVTHKYYDEKLEKEIQWIIQHIRLCCEYDNIRLGEIREWAKSNLASRKIYIKTTKSQETNK